MRHNINTLLDTLPMGFKGLYTNYQCPQTSYSRQFHFQIISTDTAAHANTLAHHQRARIFVPSFNFFLNTLSVTHFKLPKIQIHADFQHTSVLVSP